MSYYNPTVKKKLYQETYLFLVISWCHEKYQTAEGSEKG